MIPTPKAAPYLTIAQWTSRLKDLHMQAMESGLSEDELRNVVFDSITMDAPNRIQVIQPLLSAIEEGDVFSKEIKNDIRNLTWKNNYIIITKAMSDFIIQYTEMLSKSVSVTWQALLDNKIPLVSSLPNKS